MTPTEKAIELVTKYKEEGLSLSLSHAKLCSLIVIEEIENALIDCGELSDQLQNMDRELNFWQNVRKEIETL